MESRAMQRSFFPLSRFLIENQNQTLLFWLHYSISASLDASKVALMNGQLIPPLLIFSRFLFSRAIEILRLPNLPV